MINEINELFRIIGMMAVSFGIGFLAYCLISAFSTLKEIKARNR